MHELTRRGFLGRAGFAAAGCLGVGALTRGADVAGRAKGRPNIVLIYADDLGYGDVGCYGATKIKTPNIDRLAREGRMFTDAHSASAVCTPSRYGLLTGQFAWRRNPPIWVPIFHKNGLIIDTKRTTIASMLKKQDYTTACIGKWHLGFGTKTPNWNGQLKPGPLEVGFDRYYGVPVVNSHPPFVYVEDHRVVGLDPKDPIVNRGRIKPGTMYSKRYPEKMPNGVGGGKAAHAFYRDEEVCTTLTGKAVNWIRKHKDERFFLYFATTNIHHPFTPHPRFQGTSGCGLYGDFVHELDWAVGEVLKTLDELKLADDTLVIFTSDNGGMLNGGGHKAWEAGHRLNGEMFGFKFDAYEGGHRVPFIARWPGRIKAHTRSGQLVSSVDMLATLAAIAGYKLTGDEGPDSFNALPALTGEPGEPIRDHLLQASRQSTHLGLRMGKWVYIPAQGPGGFKYGKNDAMKNIAFSKRPNSDITPDGKIKPGAPHGQLYDLQADVRQTTNVYAKHPEVVAKMKALLARYKTAGRSAPRR